MKWQVLHGLLHVPEPGSMLTGLRSALVLVFNSHHFCVQL